MDEHYVLMLIAIQIYFSTSAPSKFTWRSLSLLSEPNAPRTQPFRTWQHPRFSPGRTQQALLQHQSLTAPLVSSRKKKLRTAATNLIWTHTCVCRETEYLVEERNRYTVTRGIIDNSVKCGLIYSIWPNLNPQGLHIRACCCATIGCRWTCKEAGEEKTFSMSPMLQTKVPGIGVAYIHSPERFCTYKITKWIYTFFLFGGFTQ